MSRPIHLAATLLLAGLIASTAACDTQPPPPPAAPAPNTGATPDASNPNVILCLEAVTVQNRKPVPERITVKAPCRILFTNRDTEPIQVRGPNFLLGELGKDEAWVQSFRDPGSYEWVDGKNPGIKGVIIVTP